MGVPAPLRFTLPSQDAVRIGLPVAGATLGGVASAANHLAGTRGRHWTPIHCTSTAWESGDGRDTGWPHDTQGQNEIHLIPITTSPLAKHLALHVLAACRASGGSTDPYVAVSLETGSGAVIDPGVLWRRSDGTLLGISERYQDRTHDPAWRRWMLTPVVLTTGTSMQDSAVTIGIHSAPRLLVLGAHAGDVLVMRVVTDSATVLSITPWEWVEQEIEP